MFNKIKMSEKNELLTLSKKEEPLFLLSKTKRKEIKKKFKKKIFSILKGEKTLTEKIINTPVKLVSTPQNILESKSTDCNTTPQIKKKNL